MIHLLIVDDTGGVFSFRPGPGLWPPLRCSPSLCLFALGCTSPLGAML